MMILTIEFSYFQVGNRKTKKEARQQEFWADKNE